MNLLIQPFYGFVSNSTPPDDLGQEIIRVTDEMLQDMAAKGYRRAVPGEVRQVARGFLIVFHGEPIGWSN